MATVSWMATVWEKVLVTRSGPLWEQRSDVAMAPASSAPGSASRSAGSSAQNSATKTVSGMGQVL